MRPTREAHHDAPLPPIHTHEPAGVVATTVRPNRSLRVRTMARRRRRRSPMSPHGSTPPRGTRYTRSSHRRCPERRRPKPDPRTRDVLHQRVRRHHRPHAPMTRSKEQTPRVREGLPGDHSTYARVVQEAQRWARKLLERHDPQFLIEQCSVRLDSNSNRFVTVSRTTTRRRLHHR